MELIEGGAVTETCKRYNFEEPEMAYVAEGKKKKRESTYRVGD